MGNLVARLIQHKPHWPNSASAARGLLAMMPLLFLSAYWLGGERALIAAALLLPLTGLILPQAKLPGLPYGPDHTTPMTAQAFRHHTDHLYQTAKSDRRNSVLFMIDIDDADSLPERFGMAAEEKVYATLATRLRSMLRDIDLIARWSDHTFAICLSPGHHADLEASIQLSGRIAATIAEPIVIDDTRVFLTASCGFCLLSRAPGKTASDWIDAAHVALSEARKNGGATTRSFSKDMQRARRARADLREEVTGALARGEIVPWFQPQLSTDTGEISGFEALARWEHPDKGPLPPPAFLPALEEAGLMDKLCYVILSQSLEAIQAWDRADLSVPQVGVNFSGTELLLPSLVDQLKWELDRFDIPANRLTVEVLETVMADSPDDMIVRNINGLRALGCQIDLDDFGTGHASLTAIKRFSVNRIKIDRSFVMKADCDPDQQQMVSAILTMAEQLNVKTLAEGVETTGEHALLSQLGCDYVQGFGISRPMPFEQTKDWILEHQARIRNTPIVRPSNFR